MKWIAPSEAEIGMHVRGFDGPWLQHPFWRSDFKISTARQLNKVRQSAIKAVLVDDDATPIGSAFVLDTVLPAHIPDTKALTPPVQIADRTEETGARRLLVKSKRQMMSTFADLRMGRLVDTDSLLPLIGEISDVIVSSSTALHSILSLKTRDEYTYMHSVAVCAMMIKFARDLGFSAPAVADLGLAGLLHDVGKALVPEDVLNKKGRLTDAEFALMRTHPELGYRELKRTPGIPAVVLDVCLNHHEKISGDGYPNALPANAISTAARMGAICDVYDALTSDRCYKDAWSPQRALREMGSWPGHFDPELLATFEEVLGIYPVGARVRLINGDEAIVVGESPNPTVHALRIVGKERFNAEGRLIVENIRSEEIAGLSLKRPALANLV
ncbi:HD-GYP domain-containing protein [Pacificimonas flava]|uniref:HDIG domain protein n=1 Tax=Pacificimonas flava TaxID=1234595 RepID=M2U823_9SPHN|nr:HD-GYP domain-containing protein [Pacificimonas flava]EMD84138.1 HDIG domain protein [Pacificimonas flava]MBB5279985.1 HD-GYP domain-containing protein (c-di-GMP phosphodiesterase class II) [Pacificimonas flava]